MLHKPVIFARQTLLLLYLIAGSVHAEEGTVLFDTEQGIDETQDPVVKEIQELSESLKGLDDSEKTEPVQDVEVPAPEGELDVTEPVVAEPVDPEPETSETETAEALEAETPDPEVPETETTDELETNIEPASEGTLLFDTEQGVDETQDPAIKEMQELSKSLKDIGGGETTEPIKAADTEIPDVDEVLIDDEESIDDAELTQPVEVTPVVVTPDMPEPEAPEETIAEEPVSDVVPPSSTGTVLIDTEQGIDATQDPAIKEMQDLSKSFKDIEASEKSGPIEAADTKVPVSDESEPETPVAETPKLQVPGQVPDQILGQDPVKQTAAPVEAAKKIPVVMPAKKQAEAAISRWSPKDSDLRILQIRVDSYTFDEVIGAYQYEDIILLPLGALSSLLDLSIDMGPNVASGFIIKEENTFTLDTSRNEVILKGVPGKYNVELTKILDNDIYIDSNLLGKWLNMELDIDLFASRVWVRSEEKLPFLARIEREKRIKATLARLNYQAEQNYPQHYEAYRDYTMPFIDQTLRLNQVASDTGNATSYESITYATADLMKHESAWYLSLNEQDGVDDFRATFSRVDPDGELLGAMKAKEYSFGHVVEPRIGLINLPGQPEAGLTVSNYPIGIQSEYDRHRFIGELLPGWEIELYQNNALIGYQQTAVEGQYNFQDVPLLFGSNHFRLVFYGPKGEIREENKHFLLSQSLTKKGTSYYRASTTTDDLGGQRTTAQYDYGISKNISSTFNLVSIPLKETTAVVQHNYLRAGATGYWDALLASANIISDSEGGSATEIDLQTRIDNTVIGLNDVSLSNFFSEEYLPSQAEISRSSSLRINSAIPPSFLPRIPVTFGFKRDQFVDGGELFEITNRLSMSTRGFAITNQLTNQQVTGQEGTSNGSFQLSTNINQIRLRNIITYELQPDNALTNVALTLDPGQYKNYRLSFGIRHSLQQNVTEYSATANKLSGDYNLSFGTRYNTNGDINLDLALSVGFGYEPRRKRWQQDSRTLANHGSVSARFFLDTNQDGIFSEGDEPLEDIGVRVNGGYSKARSDEEGIMFLTGLPAHNKTNIIIAPETLVDPLWTSALEGVQVVPRPGHAITIDFPIFTTGEIDGTVYLVKDGKPHGAGSVTVELVDQNNSVITTTETAYDGFYVLSNAPLGYYRVRVSESQLNTLGLQSLNEEDINITADNPFINGIDFKISAVK